MDRYPFVRELVRLPGVDILNRDTKGSGRPILCLHGRWGRGETWIDFIRRYADRYRILAPDLRGHGLSGKPVSKYTIQELGDDMIRLLDQLGIGSAMLVGHSMGGGVAGYMAAEYPDRAAAVAILDKSAAGPQSQSPLPLEALLPVDPMTKGWPLPFKSIYQAQECIRRDTDSEASYQYFMNSLYESAEGYGMLFSAQAIAANIEYYESWYAELERIACPVLLIRSKGSGAVSDEDFSRMRASAKRCMAFEMDDPDHNVHLSDKEAFYRHFDAFLDAVASGWTPGAMS